MDTAEAVALDPGVPIQSADHMKWRNWSKQCLIFPRGCIARALHYRYLQPGIFINAPVLSSTIGENCAHALAFCKRESKIKNTFFLNHPVVLVFRRQYRLDTNRFAGAKP